MKSRNNETIPTGECVYTSGGNMPAKYVVHTVGPIWKDGNNSEESLLYNAVFNALVLSNDILKAKSIDLPAISSGIYGFPLKLCSEVFFKAINGFIDRG